MDLIYYKLATKALGHKENLATEDTEKAKSSSLLATDYTDTCPCGYNFWFDEKRAKGRG